MKELINMAGTYAGELIITGIALLIRNIEKRLMIKRNRRKWGEGERYSKIEDTTGSQSKR
jgi:hypothetical protein